jgi:hypothetical protein
MLSDYTTGWEQPSSATYLIAQNASEQLKQAEDRAIDLHTAAADEMQRAIASITAAQTLRRQAAEADHLVQYWHWVQSGAKGPR